MIFWLQVLLIVYCAVGIGLYYLQDKIIFQGEKLSADYKFNFPGRFDEINIALNATDTINLVKFYPQDSSRGVVLYFHGNRSNVNRYATYIQPFLKNGYEVWMPDYPGYGKSKGNVSEKGLYSMAYQVRKLAGTSFSDDHIILYGKSLGSGLAAYAASASNNKLLILETPYNSVPDIFRSYAWMFPLSRIIKYKIPTNEFIDGLKFPVVVFHGTDDGVIRYSNAIKLKNSMKPTDKFYTIPGGEHKTVNRSDIYFAAIDSLLQ